MNKELFNANNRKQTNLVHLMIMVIENIEQLVPIGGERELAIKKIQEAIFWCNYSLMKSYMSGEREGK